MKALIGRTTLNYQKAKLFPDGNYPKAKDADLVDVIQAGLNQNDFEQDDYKVIDIPQEQFNPDYMWPINEEMVLAVLMEKSQDDGFSKEDILTIFSELEAFGLDTSSCEFLPVKVDSDCGGTAFGFMLEAAAERLDYVIDQPCNPGDYADCVETIMNDMALEHDDCLYNFCGIRTKLFRW